MKSPKKKLSQAAFISPSITLGEYAHQVLGEQYRSMVKYENKVLADKDPEDLHDMRVGTRRLRTALQIFHVAVDLPDDAREKRIGSLAKVLGRLRDLDVQIADLENTYRPQLDGKERKWLDGAIASLHKQRQRDYTATVDTLEKSGYQALKDAYKTWLKYPQYTALAQLPITSLLPDLLSPLLSELLLHPGWLISADNALAGDDKTLHNLRKMCKHVRYQAEFFLPFYGDPFKDWIKDVKTLQDKLGKLQDNHVLLELLKEHLPKRAKLPTLQATVQQTRSQALSGWDTTRQKYLDSTFRNGLHQMLLEPVPLAEPSVETNGDRKKTPLKAASKTISKTSTADKK
ncbi:MAG: CHAD domain-containing protein [Leptolyngbyaceae cyanobacterium RU_5_1]|nr:CHAD domain-containing protein [Leptolyngbyaceae cyanobacterium RU_5_1]